MNNAEFMEDVKKGYKRSVKVLLEKEKEYSTEGNRLNQFYEVSAMSETQPTESLTGMAVKHFTSIIHMAKKPQVYSSEEWNEKITDLRNYTFLLDALLKDMGVK